MSSKTPVAALTDPVTGLDQGIRRLVWLEHKRLGQLLAEYDLTVPQYFVLLHLGHLDEGCPMGHLASTLFQSNATMTGIIDRLEQDRLVTRKPRTKGDRRRVVVQLTHKGRQVLARAGRTRRQQFGRSLGHMSAQDVRHFVRLLETYLDQMETIS